MYFLPPEKVFTLRRQLLLHSPQLTFFISWTKSSSSFAVMIELLCSFFDQENYYRECVYAISPEALAECALGGSYETGRQYVEGLWRVHFSLDETE